MTMSSDLYGTCRHCFYGTRFGYCSKGTKSSSDNIVPIFIHPIIELFNLVPLAFLILSL